MSSLPTGTVTFLFTDIEGSTRLWEEHPEAMKAALARHDELLRSAIEDQGGYVFSTAGDAFSAAFQSASEAVAAAVDAQRAIQTGSVDTVEIKARIAIHTGETHERGGDYFGPALNRCARLLALGHGGQVLVSLTSERVTGHRLPNGVSMTDLGEHRLKDLSHPERVFQLNHADLEVSFPPLSTLDVVLHNLPVQLTSFVGRAEDLAAVEKLLAEHRLVTLTGAGGSGKTRLALQAAAAVSERFEDGVWLVELGQVREANRVPDAIAEALRMPLSPDVDATKVLFESLRGRELLLVLDNYEHLMGSAPLVPKLLEAATAVKILATSRERLRVSGENVYPVPPMSTPSAQAQITIEGLRRSDAASLFLERAWAAHPDLVLDDDAAGDIAGICRDLDGLPLAIELAAARVSVLPPRALRERLSSKLATLTGGLRDRPSRQQTLRSTIDWSYQMLDPDEQTLFARLGVFIGGRTLQAAEAVCGPGLRVEVLTGLESLVDKSLLRRRSVSDGTPRFTMLETMHEYALERLEETGEADILRARHCRYFVDLAQQSEPDMYSPEFEKWLRAFDGELGNLRAALTWSFTEGDSELGCRLIGSLFRFWILQDLPRDLEMWRMQAFEARESLDGPARARLNLAFGILTVLTDHETSEARELLSEAVELLEESGEDWLTAVAKGWHALTYIGDPNAYEGAISLADQAMDIARRLGNKSIMSHIWNVIGELARVHGDDPAAQTAYEECLTLARETGERSREALMLFNLSYLATHRDEHHVAADLAAEGLRISSFEGRKDHVASGFEALAGPAAASGDLNRAARLLGAAEALRTSGLSRQVADQPEYERALNTITSEIGSAEVEALLTEGRTMTHEEAVAYALNQRER